MNTDNIKLGDIICDMEVEGYAEVLELTKDDDVILLVKSFKFDPERKVRIALHYLSTTKYVNLSENKRKVELWKTLKPLT
jgi:hypothetical protein